MVLILKIVETLEVLYIRSAIEAIELKFMCKFHLDRSSQMPSQSYELWVWKTINYRLIETMCYHSLQILSDFGSECHTSRGDWAKKKKTCSHFLYNSYENTYIGSSVRKPHFWHPLVLCKYFKNTFDLFLCCCILHQSPLKRFTIAAVRVKTSKEIQQFLRNDPP